MIKRGWQIKLNFRYKFQQNVPDVLICFLPLKIDENCENCGKCRDIERRLWETGDDGWQHGKRLLVFSTKGEKVELPPPGERLLLCSFASFVPITHHQHHPFHNFCHHCHQFEITYHISLKRRFSCHHPASTSS